MADKLKFNLQYCYGIGKLEAELVFKHKGYAIYAPNGVMKTSLAKTMLDLSKGEKPKDLAFPDRDTVCEVTFNDAPMKPEEIFVVKSYDENYPTDEVSTLLANADLKKRYEEVHKDIATAKKNLDKKLRYFAGYGEKSRENIDQIIESVFGGQYYDALLGLKVELDALKDANFANADFKTLFDPKVVNLLEDPKVGDSVNDFAQKYDELTTSSPILQKAFQYHNVNQVQQQLETNNFFEAGHSINLIDKNSNDKLELTSNELFREKIETERARVLNDAELKTKFESFESKLKNKELQAFRDYITENQHLLVELKDLSAFKRKLWLQYVHRARDEYDALVELYTSGQTALAKIVSEAAADPNDWDKVIADFNIRFLHLPFKLSVKNKSDVILKDTAPSIDFIFDDDGETRVYQTAQKSELLRVLSTGESRALYLLSIMYEIYTKWKTRKKTLFIFDDIADSFDYKNKFAIINYLEDVVKSEDVPFTALILTHNFDFLRTIESRGICYADQCRLAFKNDGEIKLTDFKQSDIQNPFKKWQPRLNEPIILVAYIPFLRNVIEYTQGMKNEDGSDNADYATLTNMLHYKADVEQPKMSHYKVAFERTFPNVQFPNIDLDKGVLDYIYETANESENADDGVNLEHKIVLSMAIRIWAEKYIVGKLRGANCDYELPPKNQTGRLVEDFKVQFNNEIEKIKLLQRINLITPSNIHINAFMYEPILDMGFGEIRALYHDVKAELI